MEKRAKVYLDWAATSFPKPEAVYRAVDRFAREIGVGNDRGLYPEGIAATSLFTRTREQLGALLNGAADGFFFTSGTTEALSTIILGGLQPGDHVITSPFEHNAAAKPLNYLVQQRRISVSRLPGSLAAGIDPHDLTKLIQPATRMVIINHVSNVFGIVLPIAAVGALLREYPEIIFVVDTAQSAGTCPIDIAAMGIDALVCSGHKGLLGPTGTGAGYLAPHVVARIQPLKLGGTGQQTGEPIHAAGMPLKFEVGTQNSWGIAGLQAGLDYLHRRGVAAVEQHILSLSNLAVERLASINGVTLHLPGTAPPHGVLSFTVDGLPPRDTATLLDRSFNIRLRDGLHCAPDAHRTAETFPAGTVRISCGALSSRDDIEYLHHALKELCDDYLATR